MNTITIHPTFALVTRSETARLFNRLRPVRIAMLKSKQHLLTRGKIMSKMKNTINDAEVQKIELEDADFLALVDQQRQTHEQFLASIDEIARTISNPITWRTK